MSSGIEKSLVRTAIRTPDCVPPLILMNTTLLLLITGCSPNILRIIKVRSIDAGTCEDQKFI
jgi:hypothetical protein